MSEDRRQMRKTGTEKAVSFLKNKETTLLFPTLSLFFLLIFLPSTVFAQARDPLAGIAEEIKILEDEAFELIEVSEKYSDREEAKKIVQEEIDSFAQDSQGEQDRLAPARGGAGSRGILEKKDKEIKRLEWRIERLTGEKGKKDHLIEALRERAGKLQGEMGALNKDFRKQEKARLEDMKTIIKKDKEIEKLKSASGSDKFKAEIRELKQKPRAAASCDKFKAEIKDLKQELKAASRGDKFKEEIKDLKQELKAAASWEKDQKENKELKQEVKALSDKLKKVYSEIKRKDKSIAGLQKKVKARVARRDKRIEEHEKLKKQAAVLKNEMGEVYYQLGVMHTEDKAYREAIRSYERSIRYGSGKVDLYYHLGLLYEYVQGDSRKAVVFLKKYLKLNPSAKNKQKVKKLIELLK